MTMVDVGMDARQRLLDLGRDVGLQRLADLVVRDSWARAMAKLRLAARQVEQRAVRGEEGRRIAAVLLRATPPRKMRAAPVAPARGTMRLVDCVEAAAEVVPDRGGWSLPSRITGKYWEAQCQLSIMVQQARAAHRAKGSNEAFVPPFTPGQIQMARHYASLVERHEAGGMKCASLEARGGGGQGGGFADAFLAEGREIDAIRRRIGTGQAMVVRRVRPSARGTKMGILDRTLVDMVCLQGRDITDVLEAHGWAPHGDARKALRAALVSALDRMSGYS